MPQPVPFSAPSTPAPRPLTPVEFLDEVKKALLCEIYGYTFEDKRTGGVRCMPGFLDARKALINELAGRARGVEIIRTGRGGKHEHPILVVADSQADALRCEIDARLGPRLRRIEDLRRLLPRRTNDRRLILPRLITHVDYANVIIAESHASRQLPTEDFLGLLDQKVRDQEAGLADDSYSPEQADDARRRIQRLRELRQLIAREAGETITYRRTAAAQEVRVYARCAGQAAPARCIAHEAGTILCCPDLALEELAVQARRDNWAEADVVKAVVIQRTDPHRRKQQHADRLDTDQAFAHYGQWMLLRSHPNRVSKRLQPVLAKRRRQRAVQTTRASRLAERARRLALTCLQALSNKPDAWL